MDSNLSDRLEAFLDLHHEQNAPILLGFSGGIDSTALLHILLKCKKKYEIHLAHIDHGWREQSQGEAEKLMAKAKNLGVVFHLQTLREKVVRNMEEYGREKRHIFFQEIAKKVGTRTLLLAHQADDQAETVLKRVFEGAAITKFSGLKDTSKLGGLTILRPLLSIYKKELKEFLQRNEIDWIEDPTNYSDQFLRGKMRSDIIPYLEKSFGKNIQDNLLRLSSRSLELIDHLDLLCTPYLKKIISGPFGSYIDVKDCALNSKLEKTHLLTLVLEKQGLVIDHRLKNQIIFWLDQKSSDKKICLRDTTIIVDHQVLFFLKKIDDSQQNKIILKEGTTKVGNWSISMVKSKSYNKWDCWRALWRCESSIFVPIGDYELDFLKEGMRYNKIRMKKWYLSKKVPAFLRNKIPVVMKKDQIAAEFLTGASNLNLLDQEEFYKISISIR